MREDGDLAKHAAAHVQAPDRFRDGARLRPRVGGHQHADSPSSSSGPSGGHQVGLGCEVRVAVDEVGRAVEDGLVGAAVVCQGQPPARKTRADVVDLRVAPAVDRLFGVADHGHVSESVGRRQPDEIELDTVGVLELVHDQIAKALTTAAAELGHTLESIDHLEQQIIEVPQSLRMQGVLVGTVDGEQDVDGFKLGTSWVRSARAVGSGTAAPVLGVQVERAVAESIGVDAAALQLEQEPQARAQQVVEVFDSQSAERVWVEWRGGAAAQPRHQLLLEQPLPGLVEDPQLARRANQVRELVQQAGADAVEGADPRSVEGLSRMGALCAPGNQIRPPR